MSRLRSGAVRKSDTPRSVKMCGTPGCLKLDGHTDVHTGEEVNTVGPRVRTPTVRCVENTLNDGQADACLSDAESDYKSADDDSDDEETFHSLETTAAADLSRRKATKCRSQSRAPRRRTKSLRKKTLQPNQDVNCTAYNLEDHVFYCAGTKSQKWIKKSTLAKKAAATQALKHNNSIFKKKTL